MNYNNAELYLIGFLADRGVTIKGNEVSDFGLSGKECGSIHRGRIRRVNGSYYVAFNSRSLVMTRVDLDSISYIRYTNSRVYLFRAMGRR